MYLCHTGDLSWKERSDVIVWLPLDRKERCSRASLPLDGSRGPVYLDPGSPTLPCFFPSQVGASPARPQILHLQALATAIGAPPSRFDASVARRWIHDSPHDPRHEAPNDSM